MVFQDDVNIVMHFKSTWLVLYLLPCRLKTYNPNLDLRLAKILRKRFWASDVTRIATLWWTVRRSNHWATETQMESKGYECVQPVTFCPVTRSNNWATDTQTEEQSFKILQVATLLCPLFPYCRQHQRLLHESDFRDLHVLDHIYTCYDRSIRFFFLAYEVTSGDHNSC